MKLQDGLPVVIGESVVSRNPAVVLILTTVIPIPSDERIDRDVSPGHQFLRSEICVMRDQMCAKSFL